MPQRWRATYLASPFTTGQLVVAEIVHDATIAATRISLHGVKRGAADFLVTGQSTYALVPKAGLDVACQDLGDTGWRPLPQDWLAAQSQCTGSAPLLGTPVDWWKTPIDPAPSTYWIWYKRSDHTPFRLVFEQPSDRLPPLGRFALSYQVGFTPVEHTGVAEIVAMCRQASLSPAGRGTDALAERLASMERTPEDNDAALERLMPGLQSGCPAPVELQWPQQLAITGLLTPFDATEDPAPTEILYDWTVAGQRTRIFPPPHGNITAQDALLLGEGGYTVTHRRNRGPSCTAGLPGTLRPDWPSRAPCTCEALIAAGTPLAPGRAMRILSCPLAPPRTAWAWYDLSGRPSVFMVTSRRQDAGAGDFAVLDYSDWNPRRQPPRSVFKKPPHCTRPRASAASAAPPSCATCHSVGLAHKKPREAAPSPRLKQSTPPHRADGVVPLKPTG